MNILEHGHLSTRRFGGSYEDYLPIHQFLDSTKLYFHHVKHRVVLHNTFGVELAVELFGPELINSDGRGICVRDIAIGHIKEDLDGHIPTLYDWLGKAFYLKPYCPKVAEFESEELKELVARPYLRSGLKYAMFITLSDFGVWLSEQLLGIDQAIELRQKLSPKNRLSQPLSQFEFRHRWQYTPNEDDLVWLRENGFESGEHKTGLANSRLPDHRLSSDAACSPRIPADPITLEFD